MIHFLRYRYVAALVSVLLMGAALVVGLRNFRERGSAFRYSVDFTGGVQAQIAFDKVVSSIDVQDALLKTSYAGASVRQFSDTEYLIRIQESSNDAQGDAERIVQELQELFQGNNISILESESVGPGVGRSLRSNALNSFLIVLAILLCYIAIRFWSVGFAVGAVVALAHDALIMLAIFILFDREVSINLITAIITVLGYSINDTIVIFSRIRDAMKTMKDVPLADVVNSALNYTFRRTLYTSITTALVVISLLLFGGPTLADLAFALLVGVIFGTSSSIFIASPVMMLFNKSRATVVQ